VFGFSRSVTMALVGWLWADLLLGLFAIFLAANTASAAIATPQKQGIDPQVVQISIPINGAILLGSDATAADREQQRIANAVMDQLRSQKGERRVAVALAFASHESPTEGDKIAKAATAKLNIGSFAGTVVKTYHELAAGDTGKTLSLELYLYQ
jgi:hypothetical protein